MSNSELIDCTRETEKLRMREIECRSGGDAESRRQIKRTIDCKLVGGGAEVMGGKWKAGM